ncbi:MAG: aminotransferase class I/II-fold pyridoxal phosphate-dependent enzyme [Candidatus Adiutrix sp.]|jgi:threonine-phosphate decarboxylase|nr:aminotransferase class I/II-fold pyridoxal phosphate-dependent enzyme [Candidatus Adiutrix sp.]
MGGVSLKASLAAAVNAEVDSRRHGGRVFEAARLLGRPWREIIDFSANINPFGPPRGLKEALDENFDRIGHYPEVRAESLVKKISEISGLTPEHLLADAGSTPQLHLLPRVLEMSRPVIIGPAFAEYEAALSAVSLAPQYVLASESSAWRVGHDTVERVVSRKPDAVFLANPANPTGRLVPYDVLLRLLQECRRLSAWLIVDEAFLDFTEQGRSLTPLVGEYPRLIVLKSLTKIFALPGLRLAYLAASAKTVARLAAGTPPWSLSSPAITAGLFCLAQKGFQESAVKGVKIFRRHLARELNALNIGQVCPSEANYLLLRLKPEINAKKLSDSLFRDGLLVRDASNFNGLRPGYLRLAVRPAPEISALAAGIKHFLAGNPEAEYA